MRKQLEEEEETGPKYNKASVDHEYLRHPHSGAYFKNPLFDMKRRTQPISLPVAEYDHNCLDEALSEWQCITVSESSFRDMCNALPNPNGASLTPRTLGRPSIGRPLQAAALGKLANMPHSFDFTMMLQKSTYVMPRNVRRRPVERSGTLVDKVNIEVSTSTNGKTLIVDNIIEGLVATWNRAHPAFQLRNGDQIVRVNGKCSDAAALIEELLGADMLRITVRRLPQESPRNRLDGDEVGRTKTGRPTLKAIPDVSGHMERQIS